MIAGPLINPAAAGLYRLSHWGVLTEYIGLEYTGISVLVKDFARLPVKI